MGASLTALIRIGGVHGRVGMLNLVMRSLWISFSAAPESINAVKSIEILSDVSRTGKVTDLIGRKENCSAFTRVGLVVIRVLCEQSRLWCPDSPQ